MAEYTPSDTLEALKRRGVALPRHEQRQAEYAQDVNEMYYRLDTAKSQGQQRTASFGAGGGSASLAMPRYFDPSSNFGDHRGTSIIDMENPETRKRLHQYCRLFYATHPIIGACHTAGTMVDVAGRRVAVEDVSTGDLVKTHLGRYRAVIETKKRQYDGDLYTFKTSMSNAEVECTSEHPLYVFRRTGSTEYLNGALPAGEYMWVCAKDIEVGDYLVTPTMSETVDVQSILDTQEMVWTHPACTTYEGTRSIPEVEQRRLSELAFDVSPDFMRFVGYLLSDGNASKGTIEFHFGLAEREYADDVVRISESVFGVAASVRQNKNTWRVRVNHAHLSRWFRDEFGHGAHDKFIPFWIQQLPTEKQRELLLGFWRGDGCSTGREVHFDSVSESLIDGLVVLLHRAGIATRVRNPKPCDFVRQICDNSEPSHITTAIGRVSLSGDSAIDFRDFVGVGNGTRKNSPFSQKSRGFYGNGFMHYAVSEVIVSGFSGTVYNMEVEEDHSYTANGIASHNCVDIYSRFPVVGAEFTSDDPELERFYTQLFLEDLGYEDFFVELGKEHWTVGEAFPLGAWDESLGIWVHEELMNPDDIVVHRIPLTGEKMYYLKPTEYMKTLVRSREPRAEYEIFAAEFGDLLPFIERGADIPVSGEVMNHVARYNTMRDTRGTPILSRGIKTLMLEDRMDSALQATADRLYAPLTLFKVGMDFGEGRQWIPGPEQLGQIRSELDLALASDFRALVTHFAITTENVFGREMMPNFKEDHIFLDERLFMVFGLSSDILKSSGATAYASSALRIEFVNQMLSSYQGILQQHYKQRAMVVAEAQGHFATERKGNARIPIFEQFLVVDEKGNQKIEKRQKLLIPTLQLKTMNLRDEATERSFMQQLVDKGVPLSSKDLMVGIPFDFDESLQRKQDEAIKIAVAEAKTAATIQATLQAAGMVMKTDPMTGESSFVTQEQATLEQAGADEAAAQAKAEAEAGGTPSGDAPAPAGDKKPADGKKPKDESATGGGGRPNVSDEKKKDMPKPKKATVAAKDGDIDIALEELKMPIVRIKRSMVARQYDEALDGTTDKEEAADV